MALEIGPFVVLAIAGSQTLPSSSRQDPATTIQKHWKGHQARNSDSKIRELKDEVRSLRTEEHIKHLTKELQQAKQALDQERKLRRYTTVVIISIIYD